MLGPQAHLGHCVYPSPFSPPRPKAAPGVGRCGLALPHLPFGPRHQQKERGSWRRGRRPPPGQGLWESAYTPANCWASHLPSHFGALAWALPCGCWVALCCSRPGTVQSLHPACVSGWPGQGYGWQGPSSPGLGVTPRHGRKQQTLYTKAKSTLGKPCSHFTGRATDATGTLCPQPKGRSFPRT